MLQLPMGNVSGSHRRRITNSLLRVLTSGGGCSKLTSASCPQRIMHDMRKSGPLLPGNLSHLAHEDTLTRVSYIFHHISQVMPALPTSRVINRYGLTLFTSSLSAKHQLIIYCTVHQQRIFFSYLIQHFTYWSEITTHTHLYFQRLK